MRTFVTASIQIMKLPKLARSRDNITWKPPDDPWVKVNTDGCLKQALKISAAGGVLRNSMGGYLGGFMANLGYCSVLATKLWGLLYGIRVAWDLNYKHVILESDNKCVVEAIHGRYNIP